MASGDDDLPFQPEVLREQPRDPAVLVPQIFLATAPW